MLNWWWIRDSFDTELQHKLRGLSAKKIMKYVLPGYASFPSDAPKHVQQTYYLGGPAPTPLPEQAWAWEMMLLPKNADLLVCTRIKSKGGWWVRWRLTFGVDHEAITASFIYNIMFILSS